MATATTGTALPPATTLPPAIGVIPSLQEYLQSPLEGFPTVISYIDADPAVAVTVCEAASRLGMKNPHEVKRLIGAVLAGKDETWSSEIYSVVGEGGDVRCVRKHLNWRYKDAAGMPHLLDALGELTEFASDSKYGIKIARYEPVPGGELSSVTMRDARWSSQKFVDIAGRFGGSATQPGDVTKVGVLAGRLARVFREFLEADPERLMVKRDGEQQKGYGDATSSWCDEIVQDIEKAPRDHPKRVLAEEVLPRMREAAAWVERAQNSPEFSARRQLIHSDLIPLNVWAIPNSGFQIADFDKARMFSLYAEVGPAMFDFSRQASRALGTGIETTADLARQFFDAFAVENPGLDFEMAVAHAVNRMFANARINFDYWFKQGKETPHFTFHLRSIQEVMLFAEKVLVE